jgi:fibro-slime domain-containing protein
MRLAVAGDTLTPVVYDSSQPPETTTTFWGTLVITYPSKIDTQIIEPDTLVSDTLFINKVVIDSIEFTKRSYARKWFARIDSTGLPLYDSLVMPNAWVAGAPGTEKPFFPLDGKGFAEKDSSGTRNYSFTMEMHNKFTYHGGEVFYLSGDDDLWLFVNDRLAIDLGGLHPTLDSILWLDSLELQPEQQYNIDMFFAERACCGSSLLMVTDIDWVDKKLSSVVREQRIASIRDRGAMRPNASMRPVRIRLAGGAAVTVHVPRATVSMNVEAFNSTGAKIAGPNIGRQAGEARHLSISGWYLLRITCFDSVGAEVGIVSERILNY